MQEGGRAGERAMVQERRDEKINTDIAMIEGGLAQTLDQ